jgi:hypothetical protein
MNQAVCVGGDSPSENMARWHQESSANTGGQSEVDQACSRGPWTLWSVKDIQLASDSLLVAGNAIAGSSLGGLMFGL